MGFYEYWHEKEAKRQTELQAAIEQAQEWVGHAVLIQNRHGLMGDQDKYGEVEHIDERGGVHIVIGYGRDDRPLYYQAHVSMLGSVVTLAEL